MRDTRMYVITPKAKHRMKKDENKISIENDVFNIRLLVFMEDEPCSNRYRQVLLSAGARKKVSESICEKTGKKRMIGGEEIEEVMVELSDDTYQLPDLREEDDQA